MAWIESHDEIWEHHKTVKLFKMLGITRAQAVGHLHGLWHFVLRNAWKDANLEAWGDDEIERGAWWEGEKGALVEALRECDFLDGFVAHDWAERAGRLVGDRLYNEQRRKTYVKRTLKRRKPLATIPNPTLPNPTQPNQNRYSIPPTLDAVRAYCLERKNSVDPQQFLDYNEARGWMMGKSKMRDWQATIRTWEKNQNGTGHAGGRRIVGGAAVVSGKYDAITERMADKAARRETERGGLHSGKTDKNADHERGAGIIEDAKNQF